MRKKLLFLVSALSLFLMLSGCSKSVNYSDVEDYSDSIVNSMLTSINNLDYDSFSSYLSDDTKSSFSLGDFQTQAAEILNNAGTFESAKFYAGQEKNGNISLIYDVKFSNLDNTSPISITFKKDDKEHKVQEFYFDPSLSDNKN